MTSPGIVTFRPGNEKQKDHIILETSIFIVLGKQKRSK